MIALKKKTVFMKKNVAIALATGIAVAASAAYFIVKRKRNLFKKHDEVQPEYHGNTHHITNVFSNAKKHAMHVQ